MSKSKWPIASAVLESIEYAEIDAQIDAARDVGEIMLALLGWLP